MAAGEDALPDIDAVQITLLERTSDIAAVIPHLQNS